MRKIIIVFLLLIAVTYSFAQPKKIGALKINTAIKIDNFSNLFQLSGNTEIELVHYLLKEFLEDNGYFKYSPEGTKNYIFVNKKYLKQTLYGAHACHLKAIGHRLLCRCSYSFVS